MALQAELEKGFALHRQGKLAEAERIYTQVLQRQPENFDALHLLGLLALQTRRTRRGVDLIRKAIAINADFAPAHVNLGNGFRDLNLSREAIASYDNAIALKPDDAGAYYNRGLALQDLKRFEEALASYDRAIALKPDDATAYYNRGITLVDLNRPEEALASYDNAIALKPDYIEAYINRGNALRNLRRSEEALASYDKAIALKPGYAEIYYNRGLALHDLMRPGEALASYDKAIALKPDYTEAYNSRGNALMDLKRLEEALASYDKAFALKPDLAEFEGSRLHVKMQLCDWSDFDAECAHLISSVRNGHLTTSPFTLLAIPSSSEDQLRCAKLWMASKYPAAETPVWRGGRYGHDRLRVAYLSADFFDHPVTHAIIELFERHDRSRFEIIGFSFGADDRSEMRKRLVAAFGAFHEVRNRSDKEIAGLLHGLQVDIAVDLMGHTRNSRPGIFAYRPAPVQATYLGYPGTTGASFIDYIVADGIVAPFEHRQFYAEKIVHLPGCFLVSDTTRRIAGQAPARRDMGLPEQGFVFCCFNNSWKITPAIFDLWMRLLARVEGSVLWLSWPDAGAERNLRRETQRRGIDPSRLVFAERIPLDRHLARHRLADLFLDTLPYNAHATASTALWAGLPVLTCRGETFAGRVAASLLTAIDLPELITASLEDYERLAIELAANPKKLAGLKRKLAGNRRSAPLFNTKLSAQHLEAAYAAMVERHRAGLAPDHIVVQNS